MVEEGELVNLKWHVVAFAPYFLPPIVMAKVQLLYLPPTVLNT